MGKMQRTKGATFEREVAKVFQEYLGEECKRGFVQCRDSSEAPDVLLPADVPLWVECKHHRKVAVHAAMKQAEEASQAHLDKAGGIPQLPVVVYKDNGKRPLATMDLEHFAAFLQLYRLAIKEVRAWRQAEAQRSTSSTH